MLGEREFPFCLLLGERADRWLAEEVELELHGGSLEVLRLLENLGGKNVPSAGIWEELREVRALGSEA